LALGFHHKTQTPAVSAQLARGKANGKSARVPQRVEQAWARTQVFQARFSPGQVIGFFGAGVYKLIAQMRVARGQGLRGVKRLSADFAHMVNPHQSAGLGTLGVVEVYCVYTQRWVWACGVVRRKNGAQALVYQRNKGVKNRHLRTFELLNKGKPWFDNNTVTELKYRNQRMLWYEFPF
jgi:hypothetical protein